MNINVAQATIIDSDVFIGHFLQDLVVQTLSRVHIRGSNIKYIRIPDEVQQTKHDFSKALSKVLSVTQQKRKLPFKK